MKNHPTPKKQNLNRLRKYQGEKKNMQNIFNPKNNITKWGYFWIG